MNPLQPQDRELIRLSRIGHELSDADRVRLKAAIMGRIASTGTAPRAQTMPLAAKAIAVVTVAGAVASGAVWATRAGAPSESSASHRALETPPALVAEAVHTAIVAAPPARETPQIRGLKVPSAGRDAVKPASAASPEAETPSLVALAIRRSQAVSSPQARGTETTATGAASAARGDWSPHPGSDVARASPVAIRADELAREARLLKGAFAALRDGDASSALTLLDQHAQTFPGGALADERDVERVAALCRLGRKAEARSVADAFLAGRPPSRLTERVRESCAEVPTIR
ncbi:MAG: hypothetical protein ABSF69_22890 [Polyangiaceae bacterium]